MCPKEPRAGTGGGAGLARAGRCSGRKGAEGVNAGRGKGFAGLQLLSAPNGPGRGRNVAQRREGRPGIATAARCLLAQNLGERGRDLPHLIPGATPPPTILPADAAAPHTAKPQSPHTRSSARQQGSLGSDLVSAQPPWGPCPWC